MARPQESPTFPTAYGAGATTKRRGLPPEVAVSGASTSGGTTPGAAATSSKRMEKDSTAKKTWLVEKFKKLRELSEVVGGPKWKNLIRRIGMIFNGRKQNKMAAQFRYSPEGYARNFAGDCQDDDGILLRSFSARFAPGFSAIDQKNNPPMYVIDY